MNKFDELLNVACDRMLIDRDRSLLLYHAIVQDYPQDAAIAELGVYRGGTSLLMHLSAPDRSIYLFDTFAGLPEQDSFPELIKPGMFQEELSSLSSVTELFAQRGDLSKISFFPGFFPDTTANISPDVRFCVVHLDGDYYSTTLAGLRWFWPRMVSGGTIFVDDYGWHLCPGVKTAMELFASETEGATIQCTVACNAYIVKG